MESKIFINGLIAEKFGSEYIRDKTPSLSWKDFIKIKDLGIICVRSYPSATQDEYEIIDEKKWLLTKIKYGF